MKTFVQNQPKPEMVCVNPRGQHFELHDYIKQFPFMEYCKECGKHNPDCNCWVCKGEPHNPNCECEKCL